MDWKMKYDTLSADERAELAKDIAFVEAVNDVAVGTQGQLLAANNAEPFRQFIVERRLLNNGAFVSDEHWFLDEGREKYATRIRDLRKLYEADENDKAAVAEEKNVVLEQLEKLEQQIATLQAAKADAEVEADADEEEEAKPDAQPAEDEADDADADEEESDED